MRGAVESHAAASIDPEALLALTAGLAERDPRLRDESLDWRVKHHRYLSRSRLGARQLGARRPGRGRPDRQPAHGPTRRSRELRGTRRAPPDATPDWVTIVAVMTGLSTLFQTSEVADPRVQDVEASRLIDALSKRPGMASLPPLPAAGPSACGHLLQWALRLTADLTSADR